MANKKVQAGWCSSCKAPIWWVESKNGKAIPVNHERILVRAAQQVAPGTSVETIVTSQGETVRGVRVHPKWDPGKGRETEAGLVAGGRAHFATCPKADQHRKRGAP